MLARLGDAHDVSRSEATLADVVSTSDELVELVEMLRILGTPLRNCLVVGAAAEVVAQLVKAAHPACATVAATTVSDVINGSVTPLFDGIVLLEDALDGLDSSVEALRTLGAHLTADGLLVGRARPSRSAGQVVSFIRHSGEEHTEFRVTRRELISLVARAGLDLVGIRVVGDPHLQVLLPLDGAVSDAVMPELVFRSATAEEIEEITAALVVFVARSRHPGPVPDISVLVACSSQSDPTGGWSEWLSEFASEDPLRSYEIVVATTITHGLPEIRSMHPVDVVRIAGPAYSGRLWDAAALRARGRRLLFLTDDLVPRSGCVDALWAWCEVMGTSGIAGGRVMSPSGLMEQAGYTIGPRLPFHAIPYPFLEGGDPDSPEARRSRSASGLRMEGSMIDRSRFAQIGGLDRLYRGEMVGMDLSLRLRSRGWNCDLVPGAVLDRRAEVPRASTMGQRTRTDENDDERQDRRRIVSRWGHQFGDEDEVACRVEGLDVGVVRRPSSPRPVAPGVPLPIVWSSPLLDRTGYSNEARNMVLALEGAGFDVRANAVVWGVPTLSTSVADWQHLERIITYDLPSDFVHVTHILPSVDSGRQVTALFRPVPGAALTVGRTMFETDGVPEDWVHLCNEMDQVWVPSAFNFETFAAAGVDEERLRVVPSPIADHVFRSPAEPLVLPGSGTYTFLSVFAWGLRKGWDLLTRSFIEEFERGEAKLVMKVTPAEKHTLADHQLELERFIVESIGRDPDRCPEIYLIDSDLGMDDMLRLYRSADAFVLPSRGEGWGRPYMEAMAAGLPTIGSRWSGNLEFMDDQNSYLIDCATEPVAREAILEVPQYRGHHWAAPSVEHLRQLMRSVMRHPDIAAVKANRGRAQVLADYGWEASAKTMAKVLNESGRPPARAGMPRASRPVVQWEGPAFIDFGMAVVNRELCARLESRGDVELLVEGGAGLELACGLDPAMETLARAAQRQTDRPVEVTVRHQWPPDFRMPATGKLVVYQPWEYGAMPVEWVERLSAVAAEVWVPSQWVRDACIRSGLPPESVVVIPNGVDVDRFHPAVPPTELPTDASFVFLFVGGTLWRKGADVLLETYLATFTADDDVCLVIKDFGSGSFYSGQLLGDSIRRAQDRPGAPEIVYIDWDLTPDAAAGMYTAADCYVHPFRGEGFGLPIAEAMASGCPPIVPRYGPCLDYTSEESAFLVPSIEVQGTEARIGDVETVAVPWWGEVDRRALADAMRAAVSDPVATKARGLAAAERIRATFTWDHAADRVVERLGHLTGKIARQPVDIPAPRLSVCMIVKDESRLLATALESVRGYVDELIVVDTGSTDDTVSIALSYGALVSHAPWTGSFAEARNTAIERATGDWILMLDADQRVEASSWEELRRLLHVQLPTAYLLRQWNYTEPVGEDAYIEHLIVRLFPNRPEVRYEGAVHEQIVCSDETLGFQVGRSDIILHHDGYRPQHRNATSKAERDRIALERELRESPEDGFGFYNLGMTYRSLGLEEEAAAALQRSIELGVSGRRTSEPPGYVLHSRIEIGRARGALGHTDEAIRLLEVAVRSAPDSPDAWAALGAAYAMAGRWTDALEAYRSVQSCPVTSAAAPTDRTLIAWKGSVGEAQILRMLGRLEEAADVLSNLRARGHNHLGVVVTLAEVHRDQGDIQRASELLEALDSDGTEIPGVADLMNELLALKDGGKPSIAGP